MAKSVYCVIAYSVVLIILFTVFCFLMTTVNPEPIKIERSDDGLAEAEVRLENIIFDEVLLPPADNAIYGLEKTYTDVTGIRVPTKPYRRMPKIIRNSSALFNFTTQRVKPPIWNPTTNSVNDIINTSNSMTITASDTETLNSETNTIPETTNEAENTETIEVTESSTSNTETAMKGRRRSIKDFGGHTNESVILHISDDSGQLQIEIKLGSNGLLKSKKENLNHETDAAFSIGIEKKYGEPLNISKIARNSAIQVLPNNTVIIDEFDDDKRNNEIDFRNSTADSYMKETATNIEITRTSLDITTEQITDNIETLLKQHNDINKTEATPYTEVYALKVLFDNETKSIVNMNNDDEFHTITIKDILNDNVNYTELYANSTDPYDVNNNSVTIEKPYN